MSIALSKAELRRFLSSSTSEVLCIRGAWGTGKTYALREVIGQMAIKGEVALNRYSYVSLFGLDSMATVRSAIFDNTIKTATLLPGETRNGLFDSLADLEGLARKSKGIQAFLPGNWGRSGATAIVDRATFAFVRDQIVCFDDLERASKALSIRDILGLTTFLKEDRNCKIVLILNESKLDDEEKFEFNAQFEKVVDSSIVLEPTMEEAIAIAFRDNFEGADEAKEAIAKLDIRNIRVITKIVRIIKMIQGRCELDTHDLKQVITTSALAGWMKFQGGSDGSLADLKAYNGVVMQMRSQREGADPLPDWISKPEALDFSHSDELDHVIIDALDKGYVDAQKFLEAKKVRDSKVGRVENNEEFSLAWKLYHESLNKDDREVAEAIFSGMKSNYKGVSLLNLNGTVCLFRELQYDDLANQAISEYFSAREFNRRALENELEMWGHENIDPQIREHFDKLKAEYVDTRNPVDVLVQIAKKSSWNYEDIELIKNVGVHGLISVLDRIPGEDLSNVLKFLIRFVRSAEEPYAEFGKVIEGALSEVSARSPMNERKLRSYGFRARSSLDQIEHSP